MCMMVQSLTLRMDSNLGPSPISSQETVGVWRDSESPKTPITWLDLWDRPSKLEGQTLGPEDGFNLWSLSHPILRHCGGSGETVKVPNLQSHAGSLG